MELIYSLAPLVASIVFGAFAITTDPERHQALRLLFLMSCFSALLVFMNVTQQVALYGETILEAQNVTYQYNETGVLMNTTTTFNYTHISPLVSANYDMIWLVVSVAIWLIFFHIIISLIGFVFEWINRMVFKRNSGMDEIG